MQYRNLVRRSFKKLLEKAKLPEMRFHDLRHTHASQLLRAGAHPKVVAERLGHTNVGFTLDTYSHLLPTMQRDAADRINAAFDRVKLQLDYRPASEDPPRSRAKKKEAL